MVFKVMAQGECMGVGETREHAEAIIRMRKLGRNGMPNPNSSNYTKAWTLTYEIVPAQDSGGTTVLPLGKLKKNNGPFGRVVYGPFK